MERLGAAACHAEKKARRSRMSEASPHSLRTQSCNLCRFWLPEARLRDTARHGECRRRAPLPNVVHARDSSALELKGVRAAPMWATTRHDDWCGEFDAS